MFISKCLGCSSLVLRRRFLIERNDLCELRAEDGLALMLSPRWGVAKANAISPRFSVSDNLRTAIILRPSESFLADLRSPGGADALLSSYGGVEYIAILGVFALCMAGFYMSNSEATNPMVNDGAFLRYSSD